MPVSVSHFQRSLARLALGLWLTQLGCSNEYLVLETVAGGSEGIGGSTPAGSNVGANAGQESGGSGFGGTASEGGSFGGSPEVGGSDFGGSFYGGTGFGGSPGGGSESGGTGFGGSEYGGTAGSGFGGNAGSPMAGSAGIGGASASCATHSDCGFGALCSGFQCTSCAEAPDHCQDACAHGFTLVNLTRNGCQVCECVPPSECAKDADCAGGESCYAGQHCQDGCNEPSCCFGNQCSPSGCGAPPAACLEFGCSDGRECLASCDATSCECSGSTWSCQSTTGGAAVASCPQACAPP